MEPPYHPEHLPGKPGQKEILGGKEEPAGNKPEDALREAEGAGGGGYHQKGDGPQRDTDKDEYNSVSNCRSSMKLLNQKAL